jgi:hypothetical protein
MRSLNEWQRASASSIAGCRQHERGDQITVNPAAAVVSNMTYSPDVLAEPSAGAP